MRFKLKGLSRVPTTGNIYATCEPLNKEETFPVLVPKGVDANALWRYVDGDWKEKKVVILSFTTLDASTGIPTDPEWDHIEIANKDDLERWVG